MTFSVPEVKPSVSVVIPAYNEAGHIGPLIERVRRVGPDFEIVVVDDGSTDATAQEAREAGAVVVAHPYNLGNGAAVQHGVRAAQGEVVVLMDGDGQHQPEDIPRLLEGVGHYDMVVGARPRLLKDSALRGLGNRLLIALAQWLTKRPIPDLTSGFRAIKRSVFMDYIHLLPLRYSYPTTITIATLQGGHFVGFVPLETIGKRQGGQSNIKPVPDGLRFLKIIFRIMMTFSPLRLFLPLGGLLMLGGIGLGSYQFMITRGFRSATVMLVLSGLFIICFGFLADQVAALRRMKK